MTAPYVTPSLVDTHANLPAVAALNHVCVVADDDGSGHGQFYRGTGSAWAAFAFASLTVASLGAGVVHASAGGVLSSALIVDADITNATISAGKLNAGGTPNRVLLTTDGTTTTWGRVDLTAQVSGTLPVGSGGTGQTSFAAGLLHSNGAALSSSLLVDADVASGAAIAVAKLAAGADGTFLSTVGTTPTWTTISGAGGVPSSRQVIAGAGLTQTPGTTLAADMTINVAGNADGSIVANANDVQVGVLATDGQHGARGGGTQHAAVSNLAAGFVPAISGTDVVFLSTGGTFGTWAKIANAQVSDVGWAKITGTPTTLVGYGISDGVPSSRTLVAGAGLTGGGDLTATRTFDVGQNADGSITVNANDIQVGILATDAQHGTRGGGTQHAAVSNALAGFAPAIGGTADRVLLTTNGTSATWGTITNAQISTVANIAAAKLAPGTSGQVIQTFLGVASWMTMGGDVTGSPALSTVVGLTGVGAIGSGVVTHAGTTITTGQAELVLGQSGDSVGASRLRVRGSTTVEGANNFTTTIGPAGPAIMSTGKGVRDVKVGQITTSGGGTGTVLSVDLADYGVAGATRWSWSIKWTVMTIDLTSFGTPQNTYMRTNQGCWDGGLQANGQTSNTNNGFGSVGPIGTESINCVPIPFTSRVEILVGNSDAAVLAKWFAWAEIFVCQA